MTRWFNTNGVMLGLVPGILVVAAWEVSAVPAMREPGFSGCAFSLPENDGELWFGPVSEMLLVARGRSLLASVVCQSRWKKLRIILSVEAARNAMDANRHSIASSKGWRVRWGPNPYVRVCSGVMRMIIRAEKGRPVWDTPIRRIFRPSP